jgi:hypothetical protein
MSLEHLNQLWHDLFHVIMKKKALSHPNKSMCKFSVLFNQGFISWCVGYEPAGLDVDWKANPNKSILKVYSSTSPCSPIKKKLALFSGLTKPSAGPCNQSNENHYRRSRAV